MATRQCCSVDRIYKAHVNTNDSSFAYESGVSYEAGTMVIYNNTFFYAISDIAADDADDPENAPDKWGVVLGSVMFS